MNRSSRQHFFEMFLIIMKCLTLLAKLVDRVYFENVFVIMEIMTLPTRFFNFLENKFEVLFVVIDTSTLKPNSSTLR